jgi:hypothetical protein
MDWSLRSILLLILYSLKWFNKFYDVQKTIDKHVNFIIVIIDVDYRIIYWSLNLCNIDFLG